MSRLAFLYHPQEDLRSRLGAYLQGAGFRLVTAGSQDEAAARLDNLRLTPPDVALAPLPPAAADGKGFLDLLHGSSALREVPLVAVADGGEDGGAEERRRALRLGLTYVLTPPFEGEEVVLTALLAAERQRDARTLSGSLRQLSVPDLLQTAEASRRSGRIALRHRDRRGLLWLRDGRVVNAEVEAGPRGREAVYEMALWEDGSFEADFTPVAVPERIFEPTSALLLEAMRRRDELLRDTAPLHAAMPDPPPPPPRPLLTLHRALTLLNVAASYAAEHLEPALLARRLEEARRETEAEHPVLALFQVTGHGAVAVAPDAVEPLGDPQALVRATARWLARLFSTLERALPGRFSLRRLRSVTEAVQEDLASLGFYRELGLDEAASGE